LKLLKLPHIILCTCLLAMVGACVKPVSSDPHPRLEYKNAYNFALTPAGNDTAVVVFGYEDGDGNLFVDDYSQDANVIVTTKYYNSDSAKFLVDKSFSNKIKQPDNGYYKGKAIKGEVYMPLLQYRSSNTRKIIMFELFMVDRGKNKSNVVTSPSYTLNF